MSDDISKGHFADSFTLRSNPSRQIDLIESFNQKYCTLGRLFASTISSAKFMQCLEIQEYLWRWEERGGRDVIHMLECSEYFYTLV